MLAALKRIFLRSAGPAEHAGYPGVDDNTVVYAVGDIHGRADLLAGTFAAIDEDIESSERAFTESSPNQADTPREVLEIYLGDYVDRGPQSFRVIDMLIERRRDRHVVCLAGNHESIFFGLLRGEGTYDDWAPLGGRETLLSYGLNPSELAALPPAARLAALQAAVPPDHRAFFASLVLSRAVGPYVFVHAGIRPNVAMEDQAPRDLLWIRRDFLNSEEPLGAIVVHGHTPVAEVDFRRYRINIDTGAYMTNRLTCLKIDASGPCVLGDAIGQHDEPATA